MKTKCKDCPFSQAIEGRTDKIKCTLHIEKEWYNQKEPDHSCDFSEKTVKLLSGQEPSKHRLFVLVNDKFRHNLPETLNWAGQAIVEYYRDIMEEYSDWAFATSEYTSEGEFRDYFGQAWGGRPEFVYLWYPKEDFESWTRCGWTLRNNGLKYIPHSDVKDENNQVMASAIWEDDIYDKRNYDYNDYDWGVEYALKCLLEKLERI